MADWYQTYVIDTERSAALWVLIGFVVTYAITRSITLKIRRKGAEPPAEVEDEEAGGGLINDIHIGGVHVHHQVWGILLVLITGLLEFRYSPGSPGQEILGALFGVGAALALDEFALWLHVEDVYWSEEGKKSIDAVMIAVIVGAGLLIGAAPLGLSGGGSDTGVWFAMIVVVVHISYTIICMLKGKIPTGLIGLVISIVSLVGAIRLAKPSSYWAKRFYDETKLAKAEARFAAEDARREKWRSRFGSGSSLTKT
jgi:uncharacterized membrane protein YhaH (DUF805 family)